MRVARILIIDLDPTSDLGSSLRRLLGSPSSHEVHFELKSVASGPLLDSTDLLGSISTFDPDIILLVLSPTFLREARVVLQAMRAQQFNRPTVLAIEEIDPDKMFELLRLGAADFITPPLRPTDVLPRIWRHLEWSRQEGALTQALKEKLGLKQLVGESPTFFAEIRKIPPVAKCDASVLLSGETGTGKELCARAVHYLSPRAHKAFIPISCGAIPVELMENELFGHERGAYTSAATSQVGLIQEADGGTLFLDEIDCLSLQAQVKLLRFLQEKEYRPLGSAKILQADVRIIAAANINLERAVKEGKLRQDLYYRLNTIALRLPPLRERQQDIPLLAQHFLEKYSPESNVGAITFSPDAIQKLMLYQWPGNVRELEYIVQRSVLLCETGEIRGSDIDLPEDEADTLKNSFQEAKARIVAEFERAYIRDLLFAFQGNITKAAQAAKKNRRAFWELIRKHRINVESFRPTAS